jgi:hypothetical protein
MTIGQRHPPTVDDDGSPVPDEKLKNLWHFSISMGEQGTYWTDDHAAGLLNAGLEFREVLAVREIFPLFHPLGFSHYIFLPPGTPAEYQGKPLAELPPDLASAAIAFSGVAFGKDGGRDPDLTVYWPLERILVELEKQSRKVNGRTLATQDDQLLALGPKYPFAAALWAHLSRQPEFIHEHAPGDRKYTLNDRCIGKNEGDATKDWAGLAQG